VNEDTARLLRQPFDPADIDQLPRKNRKTDTTVMLDYVGHANVTDRLLQADPAWTWEPLALDAGLPAIIERGDCLELWIRLTVDGVSRIGVGTVPVEYARDSDKVLPWDQDTAKELIGDAIRNAAMRFGVALDLWRKHDRAEAPVASGPPCPDCAAPVQDQREAWVKDKAKVVWAWRCINRACQGGNARKGGEGNWPWASRDPKFFDTAAETEHGGTLMVEHPSMPVPEVTGGFDIPTIVDAAAATNAIANLAALHVSEAQARSELEAYASAPDFAAGTLSTIRGHVNRAVTLCVALGLDHEGLLTDLFTEWQGTDDTRRILTWSTAKAHDVLSFAKHVQAYLRGRLV
jgi:hypothetical protein